jgi:hypothetical protein
MPHHQGSAARTRWPLTHPNPHQPEVVMNQTRRIAALLAALVAAAGFAE